MNYYFKSVKQIEFTDLFMKFLDDNKCKNYHFYSKINYFTKH